MAEKEEKDQLEAYAKEKFGVDLDKRYSLENLREQVEKLEQQVEELEPDATGYAIPPGVAAAQPDKELTRLQWMLDRALAIWEGQSSSLPLGERVGRIRASLKERGYTQAELEQIELPTNKDYKRYL